MPIASCVSVLVMDCTRTGASPPIVTTREPQTARAWRERRGLGDAGSIGRQGLHHFTSKRATLSRDTGRRSNGLPRTCTSVASTRPTVTCSGSAPEARGGFAGRQQLAQRRPRPWHRSLRPRTAPWCGKQRCRWRRTAGAGAGAAAARPLADGAPRHGAAAGGAAAGDRQRSRHHAGGRRGEAVAAARRGRRLAARATAAASGSRRPRRAVPGLAGRCPRPAARAAAGSAPARRAAGQRPPGSPAWKAGRASSAPAPSLGARNGALMPSLSRISRGAAVCGSRSSTGCGSIFRVRQTLEASARTNTASGSRS